MERGAAFWLATWGGSGLAPKAPGTFGTLAALPFILFVQWVGGSFLTVLFGLAVYLVGVWATQQVILAEGNKDPSHVVIDEVVGMTIAALPAALDWRLFLAAFILFRLFDALKPWPVSWADTSIPDAHGVMLDDVLAGLMVWPFVYGLSLLI